MNFSDVMIPIVQEKPALLDRLTAEASLRPMVGLLAILVLLLHLLVIIWLLKPAEPVAVTQPPKVMEVALLSAPSPKPAAVPPAPPKPKPVPPKKVQPKKPPVKQPVKKQIPVISKPAELPKPQPVVEEPPQTPPSLSDSSQTTETSAPAPQPAVNPSSKPAEKAGIAEANSKAIVSGVKPLVRVQPDYPPRLRNRRIEGWIKIEFTITTNGGVTDAVVVDAEPADVFDDVALKAIKKWKFEAKLVNGAAVTQRAVQILKFQLSK
jgi:protein TonB